MIYRERDEFSPIDIHPDILSGKIWKCKWVKTILAVILVTVP